MVTRAFKFRVYPTSRQHAALGSMMAAHAEVYNAALQERRDAYRTRGVRVKASEQMAQLTQMRLARPDQAVWSFTSQQQTLRRLDKAFAAFFRRVKAGERPGYPRFRSAARFDSVDFRHGDGLRFTHLGPVKASNPSEKNPSRTKSVWPWVAPSTGKPGPRGKREVRLHVQGVGTLRVWMHRPIPEGALLGQVSLKREGGLRRPRWFVVVPVEVAAAVLPRAGAVVGIDLATGENGLAYTSDGVRLDNPRHLHRAAARLATAQQDLARKKRGSANRRKSVDRVARLHAKVARARLDHLHKQAAALVAAHDLIAVEDLQITIMTRRAAPKPDPETPGVWLPNGSAAKTGLNKSILDAGWGIFIALLHAKAESAGRAVIEVDPRNTSRICATCGHCDPAARQDKRYTCTNPDCEQHDTPVDADTNAAKNILRVGLAQYAQAA